jgi:3'-5' exoribonuclease
MLNQKNITEFGVGEFLNLELRDISGTISAKMWDGFDVFSHSAKEGNITKVDCKFDEYNGTPQLIISRIRIANTSDNVTHSDFLPRSKRDLEEMKTEWSELVGDITILKLKELIQKIFDADTKEKYFNVPAGKVWHHAYIHGLLEHTLEIIKICKTACDIHPELNRDLLVAGAILHDFGKVEELAYETNFDYTDKGKLIGHIVIAAMQIEEKAKEVNDFPEALKNQLIHLVLSHQGKLEHASPVIPKMPEAVVLYHADELSAKSNAYLNVAKNDRQGNSNWSNFIRLAETAIYIPPTEEDESLKESLFD